MRDHLDVDVVIPQRGEQPPGDTNRPFELKPDQADNDHVMGQLDIPMLAELAYRALQVLVLVQQVRRIRALLARSADDGDLGVHGDADVELVHLKEVDVKREGGEDAADFGEERGVADFAVRVHVHDGDLVLHRHGGRAFGVRELVVWAVVDCDESAAALGEEDVFDADWDFGNAVFDGEMVEYFGAVESAIVLNMMRHTRRVLYTSTR